MAIYTKGENKIGYKITVWSSTGRTTSFSGLSEGQPLWKDRASATPIKGAAATALRAAVGGGLGVGAALAAAGIAGGALGEGVSAIVMKGIDDSQYHSVKTKLSMPGDDTCVGITIAGDFSANYKIESVSDVDKLKGLLAIIPATFLEDGKPYYMGKSIINTLVRDQLGACKLGKVNIRYTIDV